MNFGDDEIGRAVERSFKANRAGKSPTNPTPRVDAYDIKQHTADQMKDGANAPEIWKPVMEYFDFVWYEPAQLTQLLGPLKYVPRDIPGLVDANGQQISAEGLWFEKPHEVGQWRNDKRPDSYRIPDALKAAFTLQDLVTLHRTPESFYNWFIEKIRRLKAQRSGIVLPR